MTRVSHTRSRSHTRFHTRLRTRTRTRALPVLTMLIQRATLVPATQVVVAGHSAGGHLAATALLRRNSVCASKSGDSERARRSECSADGADATCGVEARITALALLSAPLELRRHVVHEATRGVAVISALSAAFVGDDAHTFIDGDEASVPLDATNGKGVGGGPRSCRTTRLFDDSQPLAQLSPEVLLREDEPAAVVAKLPGVVALYHGLSDAVVPASSTERFEASLKAVVASSASSDVRVVAQYPECSHLDYILALITEDPSQTPALVTFLRETCWGARNCNTQSVLDAPVASSSKNA